MNRAFASKNARHPAVVTVVWAALSSIGLASSAWGNCAFVPDAPDCACQVTAGTWPSVIDPDELIVAARRTLGSANSCLRHGGQPYFQIQMQVLFPQDADRLAELDPNIGTNFPRQAWCSETVAYWHRVAFMPFLGGYANPDWHPSAYVKNVAALRTWYRTEEELRRAGQGGRGWWIAGCEIDYANYVPGVNGPCPGAYQALQAFNATTGEWADSCHHSQVVDSVVVWRMGSVTGPVQSIDVHVIEGNAGGGTMQDVNGQNVNRGIVRSELWFRNVAEYTRLGNRTWGCGGRKIRGWGIDLHQDGSNYCDQSRVTTMVIPYVIDHPAPVGSDEPDGPIVQSLVDYVLHRPGPIQVASNWGAVQTGGALPGPANHWLIPPGSPSVPFFIQVDFRANHPLPVNGVVIEWKGGVVPPQYDVQWAAATGAIMSRTFVAASGGSPDPSQVQVPIATRFGPAANYPVRYLRVAIPNTALTRPYEIVGLHYLFDYGTEDDNGGVDQASPPVTAAPGLAPAGSLQMAPPAPNPFGAEVTISWELPRPMAVEIVVHDLAGRRVRSLEQRGHAGSNLTRWDGRDETGRRVQGGAYFVEVRAGGERGVRRVVLLR